MICSFSVNVQKHRMNITADFDDFGSSGGHKHSILDIRKEFLTKTGLLSRHCARHDAKERTLRAMVNLVNR